MAWKESENIPLWGEMKKMEYFSWDRMTENTNKRSGSFSEIFFKRFAQNYRCASLETFRMNETKKEQLKQRVSECFFLWIIVNKNCFLSQCNKENLTVFITFYCKKIIIHINIWQQCIIYLTKDKGFSQGNFSFWDHKLWHSSVDVADAVLTLKILMH